MRVAMRVKSGRLNAQNTESNYSFITGRRAQNLDETLEYTTYEKAAPASRIAPNQKLGNPYI